MALLFRSETRLTATVLLPDISLKSESNVRCSSGVQSEGEKHTMNSLLIAAIAKTDNKSDLVWVLNFSNLSWHNYKDDSCWLSCNYFLRKNRTKLSNSMPHNVYNFVVNSFIYKWIILFTLKLWNVTFCITNKETNRIEYISFQRQMFLSTL